jgi:hypothetical protein
MQSCLTAGAERAVKGIRLRILIERALRALVTVILAAAITRKQDLRGWGAMEGVTIRHPTAGSVLPRIA